jgi:hypothetical protein
MADGSEIDSRELEATLKTLAGLSRAQIADLVAKGIAPDDAASFRVLTQSLSDDGLRFLSARALIRQRRTCV